MERYKEDITDICAVCESKDCFTCPVPGQDKAGDLDTLTRQEAEDCITQRYNQLKDTDDSRH